MDIVKLLERVRNVCLERFDDLATTDNKIVFTSREISSFVINGGSGDRDTDRYIGLSKNGWILYEIETVISGIGAPTKSTTLSRDDLSDKNLEDYFNGPRSNIKEVADFIKKYNEIAQILGPKSLQKIDILMNE